MTTKTLDRQPGNALVALLFALILAAAGILAVLFFTVDTVPTPSPTATPKPTDNTPPTLAEGEFAGPEGSSAPPTTDQARTSIRIHGSVTDEAGIGVPAFVVALRMHEDVGIEASIEAMQQLNETDRNSINHLIDAGHVVECESDPDGSFDLTIERSGDPTEVFVAALTRHRSNDSRTLTFASTDDTREVDFVVGPGFTIEGMVRVEGTGEPAPGMKAIAQLFDPDDLQLTRLIRASDDHSAEVDDDGAYKISGLKPGTYQVFVRNNKSRFITLPLERARRVELTDEQPDATANFKVKIGGTVFGRIVGPDGSPVEGAELGLVPEDFLLASMQPGLESFASLARDPSETDDAGRYEIRGVSLGTKLQLVVKTEDYAPPPITPVRLTEDQIEIEINLDLTIGSSISGIVVDDIGAPVPETAVRVIPDIAKLMSGGGNLYDFDIDTRTDDKGRFTLEHLRANEYRLSAGRRTVDFWSASRDSDSIVRVEVDGKEHVKNVTLVSEAEDAPEDGVASGRVTDDLGAPIVGANVEVMVPKLPAPVTRYGTTDEAGQFIVSGVGDEVVQVRVTHDSHSPAKITDVDGPEGLEITMLRNASIRGRVITPEGSPPPSVQVSYRPAPTGDGGDYVENLQNMVVRMGDTDGGTKAELDGTFYLENVQAGSIQVVAKSPGYANTLGEVLTIGSGETLTGVELVLTRGGTLTGKVIDPYGTPMEAATVSIREVTGNEVDEMLSKLMPQMLSSRNTSVTDELGEFTIEHLPHAEYEVIASHATFAPSDPIRMYVDSDTKQRVPTLQLSAGGTISGLLIDKDAKPRAGMMIQLMSSETGMKMANADSEGRFSFTSLKPGDYSIIISDLAAMARGAMKMKSRHVTIEGSETVELEIAYGRGLKVHGKITGLDKISAMQSIQLLKPEAPSTADVDPMKPAEQMNLIKFLAGMAIVKQDGTFEIEDVEPGVYRLELPAVPDNPLDMEAYKTMDRTPHYTKEIRVGEKDIEHDIHVH